MTEAPGSDYRDFFAPRPGAPDRAAEPVANRTEHAVAEVSAPAAEASAPSDEANAPSEEIADPAAAADPVTDVDADVSVGESQGSAEPPGRAIPDVRDGGSTGDPRVDDALARLGDLGSLPLDEHVAVFDEVSRRLHDALASLDS